MLALISAAESSGVVRASALSQRSTSNRTDPRAALSTQNFLRYEGANHLLFMLFWKHTLSLRCLSGTVYSLQPVLQNKVLRNRTAGGLVGHYRHCASELEEEVSCI